MTDNLNEPPLADIIMDVRENFIYLRNERIREHLSSIISNDGVEQYWKDEVIVSILSSEESLCFLDDYSDYILREDCRLLRRMLHLLRTACKKPNPYLILNEEVLAKSLGDLYLVPDGPSWGALADRTSIAAGEAISELETSRKNRQSIFIHQS